MSTPSHPNLSRKLQRAFGQLKTYSHLTIKPSDKAGNIVVLNSQHYKQICLYTLNNSSWYERVPFDTIESFAKEFYALVDLVFESQIISKPLWEFIRVLNLCVPTFYCLPKTHKNTNHLTVGPIESGVGNLTQNASILIDSVLCLHVQTLPSYIKDTPSFFKAIELLQIPKRALLIIVDVETLYNSIPHSRGIATIQTFLEQMGSDSRKFNLFILLLLEFVLTHNVFFFEGSPVLQVQGVTMGTSCATSYANLHLGGGKGNFFPMRTYRNFLVMFSFG